MARSNSVPLRRSIRSAIHKFARSSRASGCGSAPRSAPSSAKVIAKASGASPAGTVEPSHSTKPASRPSRSRACSSRVQKFSTTFRTVHAKSRHNFTFHSPIRRSGVNPLERGNLRPDLAPLHVRHWNVFARALRQSSNLADVHDFVASRLVLREHFKRLGIRVGRRGEGQVVVGSRTFCSLLARRSIRSIMIQRFRMPACLVMISQKYLG